MILYITDNPEIHKELKYSLLLYQIFDWRVDIVAEKDVYEAELMNFNLKRKFKRKVIKDEIKLNNEIIAIVTRSNYKLIYEILILESEFGKKIKIYFWDRWLVKKKKEYVKKLKIFNEFEHYLQRGFLTKLTYKQLSAMNLQRIEQFMVYLALNIIELGLLKDSDKIIYNDYVEIPEDSNVLLQELIEVISYKKSCPVYVVDKLMYHSRRGHISDPFLGKSKFLSEKNNLKKMYDSGNRKENSVILGVLHLLGGILPNTDILKTLRYLVKNEIVFIEEDFIDFSYRLSAEDIKYYLPYISKNKWEYIYSNQLYSFSGVLPNIQFGELDYSCPLCGSTEFRTTPLHFFCSDNLCKFQMDRIIKPGGLPKNITDWDFKRLIKYKSTIIKNRRGGYSRFLLVENYNGNGKFHAIPQIEKNNVGKD